MTAKTEDRLPAAPEACGSLLDANGYVNQRVDAKLRASAGWAHHQEPDFFLRVWFEDGEYRAEVWTCRRYQETFAGADVHEVVDAAREVWGAYQY